MKFKFTLFLLSLIFLLSLVSCVGVRSYNFVIDDLAAIEISTRGDTVLDYEFARHLSSLLDSYHIKEKKYKLDIDIKQTAMTPVLQKDGDSIRATIEFTVKYNLVDIEKGASIYSGKFRRINSYNTLFSPFSTDLEMQKADYDIYKSSADEIRRKLIIFFKRRNSHEIVHQK